MIPALRLTGVEKKSSHIKINRPLPDDYVHGWIHLPSLSRVRLKPTRGRNAAPDLVRFKGLGRDKLRKGDLFLPLDAPLLISRIFYGAVTGVGLPAEGELKNYGRTVEYRLRPAGSPAPSLARLEALSPLALRPDESIPLAGGGFVLLATSLWRPTDAGASALEAQGWLPAACTGEGIAGSRFRFHPDWLGWLKEELGRESRLEGGFDLKRFGELTGVPAYLQSELLSLLDSRGLFRVRRGVLLDAEWNYRDSLSPMGRGVLSELAEAGILLEKIPDSPRGRVLALLVRTGLAKEIEEGVFVEESFLKKVYRQVAAIRQREPETGLSELAERTGLKKRLLIPLLQYGDTEL